MKSLQFIVVAGLLAPSVVHAEVRRLSFAGAIELTLSKNPDLALANESVLAARAKSSGTSAKRLPSLNLDVAENYYRQPYQIMFGPSLFTLHEQNTSFTTVRISQPLTGLAYLSELVGAATHDANAASADYDRARLDAAYGTAEAYIRLLEARAGADVAHRSVTDLESELDRAQKLRQADTLTNVDVLRLQSAKAGAQQSAVRSDTASQIALAQLVITIGLHDGEALEVMDDLPATPPQLAMSVDQAIARGVSARPELRAAREHIAAAQNVVTSKKEEYLPDVRAVAAWNHATGVQPFQPSNEEYLGLTLSWNLWNWGGTRDGIREAEHNRTRAQLSAGVLADHVRLDVRRQWLDAKADFDNLAAARTQVETAEEAFRLQHVKFEAGAATTTDVLDAETEVARARLRSALARYDYYLALVSLARAMGDIPSVPKSAP